MNTACGVLNLSITALMRATVSGDTEMTHLLEFEAAVNSEM